MTTYSNILSVEELNVLHLVWIWGLFLVFLLTILIIRLIVWRTTRENQDRKHLKRIRVLRACFQAAIHSPSHLTAARLLSIYPNDYPLIIRLALDLLHVASNQEISQIIAVLELWNLSLYCQETDMPSSRGRCIQILTLIGYLSDPGSLTLLLKHIHHPDLYIQMAALRSLAIRHANNYIPEVMNSLKNRGQTNIYMLADILHHFGKAIVPSLLELIQTEPKQNIRLAGLLALGNMRSLQAIEPLLALMSDPDIDIRIQAILALGKIGDNRIALDLLRPLREDDERVRIEIAQVLGQLKHPSTLSALVNSLEDTSWLVRFHAANALYVFGHKGILLLKFISEQPTNAGLISQQILSEQGGGS